MEHAPARQLVSFHSKFLPCLLFRSETCSDTDTHLYSIHKQRLRRLGILLTLTGVFPQLTQVRPTCRSTAPGHDRGEHWFHYCGWESSIKHIHKHTYKCFILYARHQRTYLHIHLNICIQRHANTYAYNRSPFLNVSPLRPCVVKGRVASSSDPNQSCVKCTRLQ